MQKGVVHKHYSFSVVRPVSAQHHDPGVPWAPGSFHFPCPGKNKPIIFRCFRNTTDKDSVVIKAGHNYGTEWKSDKDNHWNECTCGDKANTAAHKDANADGKCDVCEYNVGVPSQPGDNSNMILWISLLMLSTLGVVATTIIGKKR